MLLAMGLSFTKKFGFGDKTLSRLVQIVALDKAQHFGIFSSSSEYFRLAFHFSDRKQAKAKTARFVSESRYGCGKSALSGLQPPRRTP
jgi:hypothetical protein